MWLKYIVLHVILRFKVRIIKIIFTINKPFNITDYIDKTYWFNTYQVKNVYVSISYVMVITITLNFPPLKMIKNFRKMCLAQSNFTNL